MGATRAMGSYEGASCGPASYAGGRYEGIQRQLHDLAQPLTTLQGQLELGEMIGDRAALLEAVRGGQAETRRMFAAIAAMREWLERAAREEDDGSGGGR